MEKQNMQNEKKELIKEAVSEINDVVTKYVNDAMVKAMVELVYGIMQTYKTDFERERALYEAICLTCRYDYDSLETGLTSAGQTPYGVLIERKAVCGGYACTSGTGSAGERNGQCALLFHAGRDCKREKSRNIVPFR